VQIKREKRKTQARREKRAEKSVRLTLTIISTIAQVCEGRRDRPVIEIFFLLIQDFEILIGMHQAISNIDD